MLHQSVIPATLFCPLRGFLLKFSEQTRGISESEKPECRIDTTFGELSYDKAPLANWCREGGGGWEKNVGHVKYSKWPLYKGMQIASDPPLSISYFSNDPPLPLPRMYWLDVYKASVKIIITWFLITITNLLNYKINVTCRPVSTSCGLDKQCYCVLLFKFTCWGHNKCHSIKLLTRVSVF